MAQNLRFFPLLLSFITLLASGGAVQAQTPTYAYISGSSNNIYPTMDATNNKVQWIFTPANLTNPPMGNITDIYLRAQLSNAPITNYTNFTVKFGYTALTQFPNATYLTGLTTALAAPTISGNAATVGNWVKFTMTTPFLYNPAAGNLIVEISQTGYSPGFYIWQDANALNSRIWGNVSNATGNGFGPGLVNFGFDLAPACTGTPSTPAITTGAQLQPICSGSTATIVASNPGGPTGMTYQWEQAATATGPWSNVTGGTGATTLSYTTPTLSTTTFYRLKAICGAVTNAAFSQPYRVAVGPLQPGPVIGIDTIACPQNPQIYTATSAFGATSYTWTLPPGWSGTSTTNSITVMPGSSNGTISVVANSNCGASAASTKAVKVIVNPSLFANATITYDEPLTFCEGSGVVLSANFQALMKYQWYKNGILLTGADSLNYIANTSGSYTVFESNNYGCRDTSDPLVVTVHPKPVPMITTTNLTLSTATNYVSYQWWYNGQPVPGASGPTTVMNANGIYYVVVTDGNGCEGRSESYFLGNLAVYSHGLSSDDVKLYPNPARDVVHVEAPGKVNLFVKAADGRLLQHAIGAKSMNVSSLPPGVYAVLITDADGRTIRTEKLVRSDR